MSGKSTVDRNGLTGDKASGFRAEPEHGTGHFVRRSNASERMQARNLFHGLHISTEAAGEHIGFHPTRAYRIDANIVRGLFDRRDLGKTNYRVFGGGIGGGSQCGGACGGSGAGLRRLEGFGVSDVLPESEDGLHGG